MKWQELTPQARRKALILGVIVAVGMAALLWPSGIIRMPRRPSPFPVRKTPAGNPGPGAGRESFARGGGQLPGAPGAASTVKAGAFLGKWVTESAGATKRGVCMLELEITRKQGEPGQFVGAATLKCVPVPGLTPAREVPPAAVLLAGITPLSAAMSGAWEKDTIAFRIDRLFNAGECGWSGLTVSRFGSGNLAADYRDACGGGAMVMRRAE